MDSTNDAESVARRFIAEYNKGTADWVDTCHAEHTEWIEMPLLGGPGRRGGREALREAAAAGVATFPDRRMEIVSLVANADRAAVEVTWTGTAVQTMAWATAGSVLRLRGVLLLTVADGQVVREVDYVVPAPD